MSSYKEDKELTIDREKWRILHRQEHGSKIIMIALQDEVIMIVCFKHDLIANFENNYDSYNTTVTFLKITTAFLYIRTLHLVGSHDYFVRIDETKLSSLKERIKWFAQGISRFLLCLLIWYDSHYISMEL